MDRLIAPNTVAVGSGDTCPTTGTPGQASSGVPGTTPATTFPPYAWNMLAEEIRAAIVQSGQTPDGTNWGQLANATKGRLLNVQVFNSAGASTYTPTAGTNSVIVEVEGGGGGSAGAAATNSVTIASCGPGGPGGYARKKITAGFAGVAITVGAGGAGGVAGTGSTGGTTSFGSLVSATGGGGGSYNTTGNTGTVVANPGATGAGVGGDENYGGNPGIGAVNIAGVGLFGAPGAPNIGGGSNGIGGAGFCLGVSSAAQTGHVGKDGLLRVWEYS